MKVQTQNKYNQKPEHYTDLDHWSGLAVAVPVHVHGCVVDSSSKLLGSSPYHKLFTFFAACPMNRAVGQFCLVNHAVRHAACPANQAVGQLALSTVCLPCQP